MRLSYKYQIARLLLNLISKTWRYKLVGTIPIAPGIVAFWHGSMLPVWKYFSNQNPTAVVSQSKDGEILSDLLTDWGYSLIRGSSSKGNKEALAGMVDTAKNNLLLITPDGPQGPIHEFKPGAVIASQRSGSKLYLCNVKIRCKYEFKKSWDNFALPLPFSKISLTISEISSIPEDARREYIDEMIWNCTKILNS